MNCKRLQIYPNGRQTFSKFGHTADDHLTTIDNYFCQMVLSVRRLNRLIDIP